MDGSGFTPKLVGCALLAAVVIAGCVEQPVQEARDVQWDDEGGDVGFQHGQEGVFVADREGEGLIKVFQPGEDVIATSTPLWSPTDKRLIFTTATKVVDPGGESTEEASPAERIAEWDENPDGRIYAAGDIKYTCWLREDQGAGDAEAKPRAVFSAACDHPGYVAANLAVRWHPGGERILFVDQVVDGIHGLFEFDLATGKRRQILDHTANALIFDFSPSGSHLACVLAVREEEPGKPVVIPLPEKSEVDGIWIRGLEEESPWWRVPGSQPLARGRHRSLLEHLRATRPAWSGDGRRFAFLTGRMAELPDESALSVLTSVVVSTRETREIYSSPASLRDLHWHPDGERIGLLVAGKKPALHIIDSGGDISEALNSHRAVRFAGWDASGTRLAYVAPDEVPTHRDKNWAFLLPPNRDGRSRVFVVDHSSGDAERLVHSGMRITFPRWSPKNEELSLWGTFTPTHRSWLSLVFSPWSLQPGDPAAIMDMKTGKLRWMAVNAHEKTQVGHYWLLKGNYEKAWQWYEQAAAERPTSEESKEESKADDPPGPIQRQTLDEEAFIFHYICLSKLGRDEDAAERLAAFQQSVSVDDVLTSVEWAQNEVSDSAEPETVEASEAGDPAASDATAKATGTSSGSSSEDASRNAAMLEATRVLVPLVQDMYIAEVYLSLDLAGEGVAFFEQSPDLASTDHERLSRNIALSQLLLLSEQHSKYADVVSDGLVPLLLKLRPPVITAASGTLPEDDEEDSPEQRGRELQRLVFVGLGGGAMLPMFAPEFLATIPAEQVEGLLPIWNDRREHARDDFERLAADLFLQAAHATLGNDAERDRAAKRVADNPQSSELLGDDGIDGLLKRVAE